MKGKVFARSTRIEGLQYCKACDAFHAGM